MIGGSTTAAASVAAARPPISPSSQMLDAQLPQVRPEQQHDRDV